jgi:hypothetical protein
MQSRWETAGKIVSYGAMGTVFASVNDELAGVAKSATYATA